MERDAAGRTGRDDRRRAVVLQDELADLPLARYVEEVVGQVRVSDDSPSDTRHHVVIIGSGFGGLFAAKALTRAPVRVTLIDRTNHHLFQPLLYQVATGILSEGQIAPAIRDVFRNVSPPCGSCWARSRPSIRRRGRSRAPGSATAR